MPANMTAYLIIHCHFYQPPRENPWLEEVECQESAEPFHNWNERIAAECYTPNSWARIQDGNGHVLDIINNYRYISFNVGPTLMSWLAEKTPLTYKRILEADQESRIEHGGHGNAIAQVYNHMIMPLANRRDKVTQVIWGIADFRYRFKRMPESIWLAETAVDYATLEVLVEQGIKYLILAPGQASRFRALNSSDWQNVGNGDIDPSRAYRCFLKDGSERSIDIFFYDGATSRAIAFEDLLHNAKKLVNRFKQSYSAARPHVQLIHVATDGETYGHHKSFGEMALAYAAVKEAGQSGLIVTNYGEFLAKYPPQFEVELKSISSWSCAHGVDRWQENCGCHTGGGEGWHQRWRKPLRQTLDWLRDQLITIFEQEASSYFTDPWTARDNYISVILNRNSDSYQHFFQKFTHRDLSKDEQIRAIQLMEMQRFAMLMYTSCAWFFSEISGIETVQVLRYAARAMQLAHKLTGIDLETIFIEKLSAAPSNVAKYGSGAEIYRQLVKPSVARFEKVVTHYAISGLFDEIPKRSRLFCYESERLDFQRERIGQITLAVGRVKVRSIITMEARDLVFGLVHAGERDFFCSVDTFASLAQYRQSKSDLFNNLRNHSLVELIRKVDEHFGPKFYTFKDLFIDRRREILSNLADNLVRRFGQTYEQIYEDNKRIIQALINDGLPVPNEYRIAAEYTLSTRLNKQITQLADLFNIESYNEILQIIKEAETYGYKLNTRNVTKILSNSLNDKIYTIIKMPNERLTLKIFSEVGEFLSLAAKLKIFIQLRRAQDLYLEFLNQRFLRKKKTGALKLPSDPSWDQAAISLGKMLSLNVDKFSKSAMAKTSAE